jgi:hypothetical protein
MEVVQDHVFGITGVEHMSSATKEVEHLSQLV